MTDPFQHMPEGAKHVVDAASVFTVVGTILQWMPNIAALFTFFWMLIRIYESDTMQRFLKWVRGK